MVILLIEVPDEFEVPDERLAIGYPPLSFSILGRQPGSRVLG
jgi:hypothetical protein